MKKFFAIFLARNKEFFKDRGTLAWVLLFPVVMIIGLSIVFSNNNRPLYKVGVINLNGFDNNFKTFKHIQFIDYADASSAMQKINHLQIDLLIDAGNKVYYVNQDSPNSYIVEKLFINSITQGEYKKQTVTGKPIRYVDWVFPGILAFNIMMNSLFGVGFVIVRYRKNGVLKRLKATPLNAFEFISAQILSRLFIVITVNIIVFIACDFLLKFIILGSYLNLFLIVFLGSLCHISLGLLFACRFKSEELANGIINLSTWPMMFLGGIWFSLEGSPKILQTLSNFIPLTHFVTAFRQVMLDGDGLWQISGHLAILTGYTIIFLILGSLLFSWESN